MATDQNRVGGTTQIVYCHCVPSQDHAHATLVLGSVCDIIGAVAFHILLTVTVNIQNPHKHCMRIKFKPKISGYSMNDLLRL
jgi:hypothetical protein